MTKQRRFVILHTDISDDIIQGTQDMCATLADYAGEPVEFAVLTEQRLDDVRATLGKLSGVQFLDVVEPKPAISAAPMSAAPFIWREDGRPDWSAMWQGFCELALYGGPPHRGEDNPVTAPEAPLPITGESEMIAEIRRGIWETTGLYSEPAEQPGWMAITCHDRKMAAWMCASIILENVEARCDEEILYVPASPDFDLKNQVKSVITVVAKVNHYWQAHIEAQETRAVAS